MFDLEVFLYGFCYFDTISTKAIARWLLVFLKAFQNAELPAYAVPCRRCLSEDVDIF